MLLTHSETQGLEAAQEPKALEEACLSSHSPMPGNSKEALDAGLPSTPASPQSFHSSSTSTTVPSSRKSCEGSSSISEAGLDPKDVCVGALDENVALALTSVAQLAERYSSKQKVTC